jgi:hypothetical protein
MLPPAPAILNWCKRLLRAAVQNPNIPALIYEWHIDSLDRTRRRNVGLSAYAGWIAAKNANPTRIDGVPGGFIVLR